jgi:hypothetical protein
VVTKSVGVATYEAKCVYRIRCSVASDALSVDRLNAATLLPALKTFVNGGTF